MGAISLRLPEHLEAKLAGEAELEGKPRSELARQAIAEYLVRREHERFMSKMSKAARALAGNSDARRESAQVADAFLLADNEALDAADRPAARSRRPIAARNRRRR